MHYKRIVGGLLAAAMLLGPVRLPALAADLDETNSVTYRSESGTYAFEKITHPEKDVKTADGIVDYLGDGAVDVVTDPESEAYNAGDRGQNYAWSALGYGDWIYVGTCYSAMGNTLELMRSTLGDKYNEKILKATFDAMFNGTFFNGEEDGVDARGILVKVNTKTGETKVLMSRSYNGYSPLFRNAVQYKDKLYFCGSVWKGSSGGYPSVWEIDPETDECTQIYKGLDDLRDYLDAYRAGVCTGIRGMCVYNDQLVISNVRWDNITGKGVATILISSDPAQGFTEIADGKALFDYPVVRYADSIYGGSIWDMAEYNGHLYVSICTGTNENAPNDNTMQSFAIVRGDQNEDGSFTWTPVAGNQKRDGARYCFGIDPERTRSGAANLTVFGDYLYIGEYNDEQIALERILFSKSGSRAAAGEFGAGFDSRFLNANLKQSVSLYRMDPHENIQLVMGSKTKMFPNGSLSGLKSGFGRNENQYIWRMQVYDGKLYIGTFDTSSLLQTFGQLVNGDLLTMPFSDWKSQWEYLQELMRVLIEVDEDAEGDPDALAKTIKYTTSFVFKNLSLDNLASSIRLLNYLRKAERGFDLYVTEDGIHFETITIDGFGDPFNHGLRTFAVTDQGLCVGTANPFYGTQIWLMRKDQAEE